MNMTTEAKQIMDNGYVFVPDIIDQESAAKLTEELWSIVASGKTHKDDQCPKSEAVHGHPVFDSLLEQLLPSMETLTGKRLHPTYAYARMYSPGEILNVHTDRPACQYSMTLTLGFEGNPWPIFMAKVGDEDSGVPMQTAAGETVYAVDPACIKAQPGDAVVYRGCDMLHWRNTFTGQWQAQVFLHYVDADGPYAEWKYDKRPSLAHQSVVVQDVGGPFRSYPGLFSPSACAKAIEAVEREGASEKGGLGYDNVIDTDIRDVSRYPLPVDRGITAALVGLGLQCNFDHYKFDISRASQSELLRYDSRGHYTPHIDTFLSPSDEDIRKLTVLLFLNDDFEGGKLFIQDGHERLYPPQKAGDVVVFPSFLLHGVEPVTSGVRRSLVTWMVGPWFR